MHRRRFLLQGAAGAGVAWAGMDIWAKPNLVAKEKRKHWAWIGTDVRTGAEEWKRRFSVMRQAGVAAVLPEVYNSRQAHFPSKRLPSKDDWLGTILPLAQAEGIEVHAWMWCMPCNWPEMREKHRDWFAINGKGESAAEKPAYVDYYRFLCPSHPEVRSFIAGTVRELAEIQGLTGVHLDYIRFPDVILAESLQPRYKIVQDREYPDYDYCYCSLCREGFRKKTGIDIGKEKDPAAIAAWKQYRYDLITRLVTKDLAPEARRRRKQITAAVFPNWQHVRQQWSRWKLDAVLPMLYHSFYRKDIDWIREQTETGIRSLQGKTRYYSGLFVPALKPGELRQAMEASFRGGAAGVSLFSAGAMTEEHWKAFREARE